eukprot:CAMPEP_0119126098 /NCGR_PEP_ID=MMETSP1310-20130426/5149_1 /TAXON_ID=464262 /ORGANISM="Genus nov. species nov., Strain RCC2339" /LENGTH=210 /DNA_ID=CAMNT_0007116233 /DNA_START=87 /DNA_END=719 /DNA_ORIENTATION=-
MTSTYLFVPNIIGYARIVLAIAAFYYAMDDYMMFFALYGLSAALDMLDGLAARYFDQCSTYGAVLDQVTDRASTASLTVILSHFFPDYTMGFIALNALDLVSHFARLYSSLSMQLTSHKMSPEYHPSILKTYYQNRIVLAITCGGNEGFYCFLYLLHFTKGPLVAEGIFLVELLLYLCTPIWALKQYLNVIQLQYAMIDLVEEEKMQKRK